MFFCSFVFLCVTSSVSFTGFYTEDEPKLRILQSLLFFHIFWEKKALLCLRRIFELEKRHFKLVFFLCFGWVSFDLFSASALIAPKRNSVIVNEMSFG